jgi:hypothetical protein
MKNTNSAAAMMAIFSMLATPVAAAEQPRVQSPQPVDVAPVAGEGSMTAERHRRYRWRRNRGIDAGDVLTGILIIGGIAAITDAARDAERDRRRERDAEYERDYRDRDYADRDYADRRDADRYARSVSPSQAAETCLEEVEQLGDAQDADLIRRVGEGWRVEGRMDDGTPYSCEIGPDGRVREIGLTGSVGPSYAAEDDLQADIDYAAARERQEEYTYRLAQAEEPGGIDADLGG